MSLIDNIRLVTSFVQKTKDEQQKQENIDSCLQAIEVIAKERQDLEQLPANDILNLVYACTKLEPSPAINAIISRSLNLKIQETTLLKYAYEQGAQTIFSLFLKHKDLPAESLKSDYSKKESDESDSSDDEYRLRLGRFRFNPSSSSCDTDEEMASSDDNETIKEPVNTSATQPPLPEVEKNYTAVHWACEHGRLDVLAALLERPDLPPECFLADKNGNTPLHLACAGRDNEAIVNLLLSYPHLPIECLAQNNRGLNPLDLAYGDLLPNHKIIEALFRYPDLPKEYFSYKVGGNTAFYRACEKGHWDLANTILAHRHFSNDCLAPNRFDITPLHLLCQKGPQEAFKMLKTLLKRENLPNECFSPENGGLSLLHYASASGNKQVLSELLNHSSLNENSFAADNEGRTPLHFAVQYKNKDTIVLLLNYQKLPKTCFAQDKIGATPLYYACQNNLYEVFFQCPTLPKECFAPFLGNITFFDYALKKGQEPIVLALLRHRLLLEEFYFSKDGKSNAFYRALENESWPLVQAILEDPHVSEDYLKSHVSGVTPLHLLCQKNSPEALSVLTIILQCKNLPNECFFPDKEGRSPLHHAVLSKNKEAITALLNYDELSPICFAQDNDKKTPLYYACKSIYVKSPFGGKVYKDLSPKNNLLLVFLQIPYLPKECFGPIIGNSTCFEYAWYDDAILLPLLQYKDLPSDFFESKPWEELESTPLHELCNRWHTPPALEALLKCKNLQKIFFEPNKAGFVPLKWAMGAKDATFAILILEQMSRLYSLDELALFLTTHKLMNMKYIQIALQKVFNEEERLLFAPFELNTLHYTFPVKEMVPPPAALDAHGYFQNTYTDDELKMKCANEEVDIFNLAGLSKEEYEQNPDHVLLDPNKRLRLTRSVFYSEKLLIPLQETQVKDHTADNYLSKSACDNFGQQLSKSEMIARMHAFISHLVQHTHITNTPLAGEEVDEGGIDSLDRFWNDYERYPVKILELLEELQKPSYYINAIAPFAIAGGECSTRYFTESKQVYVRLYRELHPEVSPLGFKDLMASELQKKRLEEISKMAIETTNAHFQVAISLTTHL